MLKLPGRGEAQDVLDVEASDLAVDGPRLIFKMQSQSLGVVIGDPLPYCSHALKGQVTDMVWHCVHRFKCRDCDDADSWVRPQSFVGLCCTVCLVPS